MLYDQGNYVGAEQAIRLWNDGSGLYEDHTSMHYQLALCLQEGRTTEAAQEFQKAAEEAEGHHYKTTWFPPNPTIEHKAQAALAWIQQNPNWQPAAPGQTSTSQSPPQDFPAT